MKSKKSKINALTYTFCCPCGQYKTSHYNWNPNPHVECQSYEIRCPKCKDKYKVIFNPITKQAYYLEPETNNLVCWTYAHEFKLTKVANTQYPNEYKYTLEQLDKLEKQCNKSNFITNQPIPQLGQAF